MAGEAQARHELACLAIPHRAYSRVIWQPTLLATPAEGILAISAVLMHAPAVLFFEKRVAHETGREGGRRHEGTVGWNTEIHG